VFEKHNSIETLIYPTFSGRTTFRPFIVTSLSVLIKAGSHNLPWVVVVSH